MLTLGITGANSVLLSLNRIIAVENNKNYEKAFDDLDSNAVHNDDNYGTKNVHHYRRQDRGRHAGQQ